MEIRGKYQHFKGGMYEVVGEAKHTETGERMVVYMPLYTNPSIGVVAGTLYARPYDMFFSDVDKDKYPTCMQVKRFEKAMSRELFMQIVEKNRANKALLDSCDKHEFVPTDKKLKSRCTKCNGIVDTCEADWYNKGYEHGKGITL